MPGASREAARDHGGEHEAEAVQRRAGARAGARQPEAALRSGAAELNPGAVSPTPRGEGDVSVPVPLSWKVLLSGESCFYFGSL